MNFISLPIILLILIPVVHYLTRDYKKGLSIVALLLVSLTSYLVVKTPGNLPNFTIHRLLLIILFIAWYDRKRLYNALPQSPFIFLLLLITITNFISLLVSPDFTFSLKSYLSLIIEVFLFYIITITTISSDTNTPEDVLGILSYICFGLGIVAFFAVIEKYTGFNPVDTYVPGYSRKYSMTNDVMSTYPHRILLGVAMAMGWPVALALYDEGKRSRFKYWVLAILLISACYFSFSRGPYLATILAGLTMLILGSSRIKKRLVFIGILVLFTLIVKPGVWELLKNMHASTMDPNTLKGSSYEYRWELWRKAYAQVSKSTERSLFGYGPGTSHVLDLEGIVSYGDYGYISSFWSWDNHYACCLLEGGFVGLGLVVILYTCVLCKLFSIWLSVHRRYKDIMAAIITSTTVMLFMMTNVYIFAPQLNYLFWTLVSVGITLGSECKARHPNPSISGNGVMIRRAEFTNSGIWRA